MCREKSGNPELKSQLIAAAAGRSKTEPKKSRFERCHGQIRTFDAALHILRQIACFRKKQEQAFALWLSEA
jgi:hypothetical protein